jgi:hypothetical protein
MTTAHPSISHERLWVELTECARIAVDYPQTIEAAPAVVMNVLLRVESPVLRKCCCEAVGEVRNWQRRNAVELFSLAAEQQAFLGQIAFCLQRHHS